MSVERPRPLPRSAEHLGSNFYRRAPIYASIARDLDVMVPKRSGL